MRTFDTSSDRFFRPSDPQATRRNHRRVQAGKVLAIATNVVVALVVAAIGFWLWQRTQSDTRFAIRKIETVGAKHTSRAAVDAVTQPYIGRNLFRLDIEELRRDLSALPWVSEIAIEKELPGRLTIHLTEREPVALVSSGGTLRYADAKGVVFEELRPEFGNPGLPLVVADAGPGVESSVAFLESLRAQSPELYARVSEVRPEEGETFRVFDRELRAPVLVDPVDAATKWASLCAIAEAEGYGPGAIEYADLRFADRVVVKPRPGHAPAERLGTARTGNATNTGVAPDGAGAGIQGVKD
ncbi:MAG: FtsQ-type POTRA domain-containing protein [Thermoanaerobaculia bacterium]|nr:FtsQ-type POTRA domain-containing protein [Thermoanaerobaculia bacterium]